MADAMIQRLLPRHFGLLKLVLSGVYSNGDMARMLGYTPENIRLVINSPLFQDELARRRRETELTENLAVRDGLTQARDLLNQTAYAAVEKLEDVMVGAVDPKLQMDAADKILKYAFPRGEEARGASVTANVVVLSAEKLEGLRAILNEIGVTSTDNPPKPVIAEQDQNGELTLTGI